MCLTLGSGPWTVPATVPEGVFFTQPTSPRLLAVSRVYLQSQKHRNITIIIMIKYSGEIMPQVLPNPIQTCESAYLHAQSKVLVHTATPLPL